jgi:glycosyltransferase involved in cell wall biosynthesis
VVTTKTVGCPEIVLDGKTGFVVSYDAGSMSARLLELAENPGLRREMGAQAQKWTRQRFNWEQMASAYAQVFLEVADGWATGRRRGINMVARTKEKI